METKLIAKNPVAYHNFNIEDKYETGIVLSGTEIKSIRAGKPLCIPIARWWEGIWMDRWEI